MNNNNRFVDNGDGTVTDTDKGLIWNKTDSMNDLKKWVNYQDSADYARSLSEKKFGGYDNWRLPTRDELSSIYDESWAIKDRFGKDIQFQIHNFCAIVNKQIFRYSSKFLHP